MGSVDRNISRVQCEQREAPKFLPPTEELALYLVHHMYFYHTDYSLYNRLALRVPDQWSDFWETILKRAARKALLCTECRRLEVCVQQYTIKQEDCMMGESAARQIGKREVCARFYR